MTYYTSGIKFTKNLYEYIKFSYAYNVGSNEPAVWQAWINCDC